MTGEYAAVTILTHDGVAITGLPAGETPLSVSLRRQGGAVEEVARRDIESLRGTGRSLSAIRSDSALLPDTGWPVSVNRDAAAGGRNPENATAARRSSSAR